MIFLRLLAAATCLRSATAAATGSLRRSIDPTLDIGVDEDSAAAAIAEYEALYQSLKADYINEGCVESWGEFPSATSKLVKPTRKSPNDMKGGMMCNCGMLYDLGLSAVLREETTREETRVGVPVAAGAALETEDRDKNTLEAQLTQVDSWVMARTANGNTLCSGGKAGGYPCKNVNLMAHLPLRNFQTTNTRESPKSANDVWGWTSSNGREFVIWGVREGTYFLEAKRGNSNANLVLLGFMPSTAGGYALQHDMKVIGDFAYIGAESKSHGMQIFDMRRLLNINPGSDCVNAKYCRQLSPDRLYKGTGALPVGNSHNIVVNEESKYVYVVGSGSCNGGLHIVDVWNPLNPVYAGCFKDGNYVHDAQCVNYKGPDPNYQNKEICFCYNENSVKIVDVSQKNNMRILSSTSYRNVDYTHQGWLSSDHSHIIFGDEGDEYFNGAPRTRTLVLNVENLRNPTNTREYNGNTAAVDHNQYVVKGKSGSSKDLIYQANYEAGLRILQADNYDTGSFKEVAYFDTFPRSNMARFRGAWSSYPYFRSGLVVISSVEEGLFLVEPDMEALSNLDLARDPNDCSDKNPSYRNRRRKNCRWVGRKRTRQKCRKQWRGKSLSHWCRTTCARVGLGVCKNKVGNAKNAQVIPM